MGYRNYGPANGFIVDANGSYGDFTTIQAAITAAVSPTTVFIKPGTYVENLTLKVGVNLASFDSDALTPAVTISGTCTLTAAGTVSISGICLQTNSAALLAVTGSAASIVNLKNCYLNCTNNTGITFSAANTSAAINIIYCVGNLGTTGIGWWTHSSTGNLLVFNTELNNSGASTTASTISGGNNTIKDCLMFSPLSTSGSTAVVTLLKTDIDTSTQNVTAYTQGSSAANNNGHFCYISSGSASAISISTTCTGGWFNCTINSSNTNCITGAGTLIYSGLSLPNSKLFNVTTQTGGLLPGGVAQAPSTGFIGETITSTAGPTGFSNGVTANLTSISVTSGVWLISVSAETNFSGTLGVGMVVGISTLTGAFQGSNGAQLSQIYTGVTAIFSAVTQSVPAFPVTLTATTTYFAVAQCLFTGGTANITGRISATRVG